MMASTNGIGSTNDSAAFFSDPANARPTPSTAAGGGTLDDLLGLFDSAGLGSTASTSQSIAPTFSTPMPTPTQARPAPVQPASGGDDDLLGLF